MAARTEDHNLSFVEKNARIQKYGVLAAETIYKGTPVCIDGTSKYLQSNDGTTITLAAGDIYVGISAEKADNSAGASGDIDCNVYQEGSFQLPFSDTLTIADLGKSVYVNNTTDDAVVSVTAAGATDVIIGTVVEIVDASNAFVHIDNAIGNLVVA